jgi:hypothetical protein
MKFPFLNCTNVTNDTPRSHFSFVFQVNKRRFIKRRFIWLYLFFFFKKVWLFKIKAVPLRHENPPSLFTMLKSAGRFVLLWHIIQRHTHHQLAYGTVHLL